VYSQNRIRERPYYWLIAGTLLLSGCASTIAAPPPTPASTHYRPEQILPYPPASTILAPTHPIQRTSGLQRDCQQYQAQVRLLQQKLTKRPHAEGQRDDLDQIKAVVQPLCTKPLSGTSYRIARQEILQATRDVEQLSGSPSTTTP